MPRVPENTRTKTPWSLPQGGSSRHIPFIDLGSGSATRARMLDPLIQREESRRRTSAANAEADVRRFSGVMQAVGNTVGVLGEMADRAKKIRDDTFVDGKDAEYQQFITNAQYGSAGEDGKRVGAVFDTPYNPGDEHGEGLSGATTAFSTAHAKWWEDQKLTPEQADMVKKRIEPNRMRMQAMTERFDANSHEMFRIETKKALSRSQADNYYKTGDTTSLYNASRTVALAQMPRNAFTNLDEWEQTQERDPAELQFSSIGAEDMFDRLYTDAHEGIQQKHLNSLLEEAVNTEDDAVSKGLFETFKASLDPKSEVGSLFLREENLDAFEQAVQKAEGQRKVVLAGRERGNMLNARDLMARIALDQGEEDDLQMLDTLRAKLPPERVFELDQFKDGFSEKMDYGEWELFRIKSMEDMNAENSQKTVVEMFKYVEAIKDPRARERARNELMTMQGGGSGSSSRKSSLTDTQLSNRRRYGGFQNDSAGLLDELSRLADSGAITADQYVKQVREIKADAKAGVDGVGILAALGGGGIDGGKLFKRDARGNIRFDGDGKPVPNDKEKTQKQSNWLSDEGVGFWNAKNHYVLSEEVLSKAFDLAREFKAQELAGVKGRGTVQEYIKKNLFDAALGKNWSDSQMALKIDALNDSLENEFHQNLSGYYRELDSRGQFGTMQENKEGDAE